MFFINDPDQTYSWAVLDRSYLVGETLLDRPKVRIPQYVPHTRVTITCDTLFEQKSTLGINIVFLTSNNVCVGKGDGFEKDYIIDRDTKYYVQYNSTLGNLNYSYSAS